MCPTLFLREQTMQVKNDVHSLFEAMTPEFRKHLMHSFMWTKENLEKYLQRDESLQGDQLINAFSYLESLLKRIEGFAAEKPKHDFPTYDQWIDQEYQEYKLEHREDHEDIERLVGEGGVVAPGRTSPAETMDDDSLSHYNHLKTEHDLLQVRGDEATRLMKLPSYQNLVTQADKMSEMIYAGIKHHH